MASCPAMQVLIFEIRSVPRLARCNSTGVGFELLIGRLAAVH